MTRDELIKNIETNGLIITSTENEFNICFNENEEIDVRKTLEMIFKYEIETNDFSYLDLKKLSVAKKIEAFKFSLQHKEFKNPIMSLNVINLIKAYNTLEDEYFNDKNCYINDIEEFLDLKLGLSKEIKAFNKEISICFLSLFKTYSKTVLASTDEVYVLPLIIQTIFSSVDILTLSSIFANAEGFSTTECRFIENGALYVIDLLNKGSLGVTMLEKFLKGYKHDT